MNSNPERKHLSKLGVICRDAFIPTMGFQAGGKPVGGRLGGSTPGGQHPQVPGRLDTRPPVGPHLSSQHQRLSRRGGGGNSPGLVKVGDRFYMKALKPCIMFVCHERQQYQLLYQLGIQGRLSVLGCCRSQSPSPPSELDPGSQALPTPIRFDYVCVQVGILAGN